MYPPRPRPPPPFCTLGHMALHIGHGAQFIGCGQVYVLNAAASQHNRDDLFDYLCGWTDLQKKGTLFGQVKSAMTAASQAMEPPGCRGMVRCVSAAHP